VSDGDAQDYDGDLDDYLAWLTARREAQAAARADVGQVADKAARKEARASAAADRQAKLARRRPLLKETGELEARLAEWHEEKREIDESLADPSFYENPDPDKLKGLALRQAELSRLIDEAEHRWLEASGELEEIGEVS
jgi:ATP-binding cassette subfamily F protein 3